MYGRCNFESGVTTEVLARIDYYPELRERLFSRHVLPAKLVELGGGAPPRPVFTLTELQGEASSALHGGERISRIREGIEKATFTGRGDKDRVRIMYNDYIGKTVRAFQGTGSRVKGTYIGETAPAEEGRPVSSTEKGRPHGKGMMR